ncbi:hypothetical protein LP417_35865 (plasmid) [Polaromonas sp. P1-6]|nr:hypothetical protein LP417_35865 [Polaromonas sp. P1-6]
MRFALVLLLLLTLLSACSRDETTPASPTPKVGDAFHAAVWTYALKNADALNEGKALDVRGTGIMINPGREIGQSLSPTSDQLKALGLMSRSSPESGIAKIEFSRDEIVVVTIVNGASKRSSWAIPTESQSLGVTRQGEPIK